MHIKVQQGPDSTRNWIEDATNLNNFEEYSYPLGPFYIIEDNDGYRSLTKHVRAHD